MERAYTRLSHRRDLGAILVASAGLRRVEISPGCVGAASGSGVGSLTVGSAGRSGLRNELRVLCAFETCAGGGLQSLSFDGDHSFLFEGIREHVQDSVGEPVPGHPGGRYCDASVEEALRVHVDNPLWGRQAQERSQETVSFARVAANAAWTTMCSDFTPTNQWS
eukprot:gnl/TRDRNA2_/TRDRNA2_162683_c3_seq4.p1 gnl/TRDRNA2_/TRDRNA2_162683_c3~~gnl/TRDRNA2_/TRDRNA2_162683_c3_seq4.p1  ORF type:complete len:165 (-),score=4.89 gnl/TRDRNA2_/TRDRNA2_162683_c3_seq4:32-526(-)